VEALGFVEGLLLATGAPDGSGSILASPPPVGSNVIQP
jgi:hypothetical protein